MRRWGAAGLLLATAWLATPSAVPVYDGVGFPDQPYRFLGATPGPGALRAVVPLVQGAAGPVQAQSGESGPQVKVDVGAGSLRASVASVTFTAVPVATGAAPSQGQPDGVAYRLAAPGAAVSPRAQGFVVLRAATLTRPAPVIVFRGAPGQAWRPLSTTAVGTDVFAAPFRAFGDYLVVQPAGSRPLSAGGGGSNVVLIAVLAGGVVLLAAVTVLVVRRGKDDGAAAG